MDDLTAQPADPQPGDPQPGDPHAEIARLEQRIEQLEARLEGCAKFAAAARFAIVFGAALLLALIFRAIPFDPLAMTGAIAAGLGGIVVLGSNKSTAQEAAAQMAQAEAEAERAALIGSIELRVVGGRETVH
jgi:hypothetical protein